MDHNCFCLMITSICGDLEWAWLSFCGPNYSNLFRNQFVLFPCRREQLWGRKLCPVILMLHSVSSGEYWPDGSLKVYADRILSLRRNKLVSNQVFKAGFSVFDFPDSLSLSFTFSCTLYVFRSIIFFQL